MQPLAADMNKPYPAFMSPADGECCQGWLQYVQLVFLTAPGEKCAGLEKEKGAGLTCRLRRTGMRWKQTVSPRQSVSCHSSSCFHENSQFSKTRLKRTLIS